MKIARVTSHIAGKQGKTLIISREPSYHGVAYGSLTATGLSPNHEGFGPLHLGEYEDLATISQIGQGIARHGPAFGHWAAICGTANPDDLARFDDVYLGHWNSVEAYAEELLDELGLDDLIERAIPDSLQAYVTIDIEGFARDLTYSGDLTTSEGDDGVYLFDQNR